MRFLEWAEPNICRCQVGEQEKPHASHGSFNRSAALAFGQPTHTLAGTAKPGEGGGGVRKNPRDDKSSKRRCCCRWCKTPAPQNLFNTRAEMRAPIWRPNATERITHTHLRTHQPHPPGRPGASRAVTGRARTCVRTSHSCAPFRSCVYTPKPNRISVEGAEGWLGAIGAHICTPARTRVPVRVSACVYAYGYTVNNCYVRTLWRLWRHTVVFVPRHFWAPIGPTPKALGWANLGLKCARI